MIRRWWLIAFMVGLVLGLMPAVMLGQATRVRALRPKPNLILGDTLTVMVLPSTVSFALVSKGVAPGSGAVAITTTWTGISLFSSLTLSGYFASASQALTSGAANIPSSAVLGKVPTGSPTSFTAFTQSAPLGPAGAGLLLYSQGSLISLGGTRTDSLSLEINLTTLPQTPAGTYTGTLILQAQAF
jgi:hypothetical protein